MTKRECQIFAEVRQKFCSLDWFAEFQQHRPDGARLYSSLHRVCVCNAMNQCMGRSRLAQTGVFLIADSLGVDARKDYRKMLKDLFRVCATLHIVFVMLRC